VLEHVDRLEAQCLEQQQQLGYASAQMSQQSDLIDALRRVIAGLERDRDTSNSNSINKQKDTNREFIARRLQRAATFAGTGIVNSSSSSANNGGNAATSSSITDGIAISSLAKRQSTGQLNSAVTSSGMPPPFPHSMSTNRLVNHLHIYF
jgi:hypothetical protein